MFFAIVAKEIIEKKLCILQISQNNKSNKILDLERKEAKKGLEMSAKIAKVTRIFHAS